jgi:GNAT superfamily N-acetyltransferase
VTTGLVVRPAVLGDLEAVVRLHEADAMGGHADAWLPGTAPVYEAAFAELDAHPDHGLFVAVSGDEVVGTMLLSFMPGLTGRGMRHAVLRAVQVRADQRSRGIGSAMVAFAETRARERGAGIIELMSNGSRTAAHRFYEREGYVRSHFGFKKRL